MKALERGIWWEVRDPFRHFEAADVLDEEAYRSVATSFQKILDATDSGGPAEHRLAQSTSNYDARMLSLQGDLVHSFAPFLTEEWLRSLAALYELPFLARVDAALHSSPRNSRTGWVHTDFCSAWFDEGRKIFPGELLFPDRSRCNYFEGTAKTADAKPVEYIRALTMIFYLCNNEWKAGDGGETGLYSTAKPTPESMKTLLPPINNRLLLFECSPHSYHRFIANPGRVRNSLILWLHSTVESTESQWGTGTVRRRGAK